MASTFHGLEIGKRSLYAQQAALATTGHNVANANTTGYTRQRAEMQASNPMPYPGMNTSTSAGQIGTGVEVNKIVRLREEYLDVQLRGEMKNLGYWEAKSDTLSKVEELLNEPSDNGLANVMDEFWKGWQELAKNPESAAVRSVVRQRGIAVTETFKHISDSLNQIQNDLKHVIDTKKNEVNSLAKQISDLNDQIGRLVPNNYEPNDLYDQRDVLIDQMSKIVPVNVVAGKNGMVDVFVGSEALVSGSTAKTLEIGFNEESGLVDPTKIQIGGNAVTLESGELLGRIESYGLEGAGSKSTIPDIKAKIDELAKGFLDSVNEMHQSGVNLDQINGTASQSVDFFVGDAAGNIAVNPEIMKSLNLIAASKVEAEGQSSAGNGGNAQAIADLKFQGLDFTSSTATADDFYRNIIGQLGIDSQESQRMYSNSEVIAMQVENRRLSVSGVSLDEEMTNMIRFQQAYNAAARYVTVMDQCLEKVINGMGRVGL